MPTGYSMPVLRRLKTNLRQVFGAYFYRLSCGYKEIWQTFFCHLSSYLITGIRGSLAGVDGEDAGRRHRERH